MAVKTKRELIQENDKLRKQREKALRLVLKKQQELLKYEREMDALFRELGFRL